MTDTQPSFDPERLLLHRKWIRAIARDLVADEARVDDVEQQVYLAAIKRPPRGPIRSLTGWLRSVIRSVVIDEHRASSSRTARETRAARPEGVSDTAHLAAQAEALGIVSSAVAELDEPYRSTVLLRYFEGLPPRAVAQRMGVPVETVRTRLKRAHTQLRARLDSGFGGDRKAWSIALVALARPEMPLPTPATTIIATATGITIMTKTTKLGIAALLALLLLGTATWKLTTGEGASHEADVLDVADSGERRRGTQPTPPPAGPPGSVSGVVRSRHDCRPVRGVDVAALGRGERITAVTDDEGRFVLEELVADRTWKLSAEAPGFSSGDAQDVPVESAQDVDAGTLWLESSTRLTVRVVDQRDRPVPGARVQLVRKIPEGARSDTQSYLRYLTDRHNGLVPEGGSETGLRGEAVFDALPPGRRSVAVMHDDFVQQQTRLPRVQVGMEELSATVRMVAGHELSGIVTNADGTPASRAFVRAGVAEVWADATWAQCDDEGRFTLRQVLPGRCDVHAAFHQRPSASLATVRVPDVSYVSLRLPATGAVAGRVTHVDGRPLVGVEVAVATGSLSGASALSDEQGRYRIEGLDAGHIDRFRAWHQDLRQVYPRTVAGDLVQTNDGTETRERAVVAAGGTLEVDVVLGPGARVFGQVLGPDGPVPGAWVLRRGESTPAGEEWQTTVADAEGRYGFGGLEPGRHLLAVAHESYYQRGLPVDIHEADRKGELGERHFVQLEIGRDLRHDLRVEPAPPVEGHVTDASGSPLGGVLVVEGRRHYSDLAATGVRSDDDGRFVLPHVRPGAGVALHATLSGHVQREPVTVDVASDAPTPAVEIRMVPARRLVGHVVGAGGSAVPGATVRVQARAAARGLLWAPAVTVHTDEDGAFAVDLPYATGTASVEASHPDHGRMSVKRKIGPELDAEPVRIDLTAGPVLIGRARHRSDGTPASGAQVYVRRPGEQITYQFGRRFLNGNASEQAVASTDADGRFRVMGLEAGAAQIVISSDRVAESFATVTLPAAGELEVLVDRASSLAGVLEIRAGVAASRVSVTLTPAENPPGVQVMGAWGIEQPLSMGVFRRATDDEGRFDFESIPPGEYTLNVHVPGDQPNTRFGPFTAGKRDLQLSLDSPVTASITGRVLDASGRPLARVSISASPDQDGYHGNVLVRTDGAGQFTIEGLTSPVYALTIQGAGIRRLFLGVRAKGPSRDFVLTPGLTIRGSLLDEHGAPLAGRNVSARLLPRNPSVMSIYAATDAAGRFELRDLEDGSYTLALASAEGTPHARLIDGAATARAGSDDVRLRATLERRVRGQVVAADGSAIPNMRLQANPKRGGNYSYVRTDAEGRFELTGLEPGQSYSIQPDYGGHEHTSFAWKHRKAIGKADQDVRLEFPRTPE